MPTESTQLDSDQETQSFQHSDQGANSSQHSFHRANPAQHSDQRVTNLLETPLQESPKRCTRYSPCLQQGCSICRTSTDHVRNLNTVLNTPAMPNTPVHTNLLKPLHDHIIYDITNGFQEAILENDLSKRS